MQRQTQEQEAARRQADAMASLRAATQPVTAQSALAAPGRVGPTAERAEMVGQTPQFTREQALQLGLNPDLPKDLRESLFKYVEATTPKEPKLPTSAQEYQLSLTNPDYAAFLRQKTESGATKISIKMNETFGGSLNKNLEGYFDNGSQARSFLPTVQTMSALLDEGVRTGFGQETMNKFNQAAQLFNPGYKAKEVAGQEAFIALSNEIILPQVKQLGVNPTDADLNFIVKGSPTLSKSVEGNKLLLNALDIKLQRDALLQEFVTNWQDQNVSLIENSPVRANSKLRTEILNLTKTHPLWTEATQRLRQQYSQITSGRAGSLTAGSPFSEK
jgi:hypothetical protein